MLDIIEKAFDINDDGNLDITEEMIMFDIIFDNEATKRNSDEIDFDDMDFDL